MPVVSSTSLMNMYRNSWVRMTVESIAIVAVMSFIYRSVDDWGTVISLMRETSLVVIILALLPLLFANFASMMSWSANISHIKHKFPTQISRIFYIGQLGKYIPGSIWIIAFQRRMASGLGVGIRQLTGAYLLAFAVSVLCSVLFSLPFVLSAWGTAICLFALISALLLLTLILPLSRSNYFYGVSLLHLRFREYVTCMSWCLVGWLCAGIHWLVMAYHGGVVSDSTLLIVASAATFSVSLGSMAILFPGGIGVREYSMMAYLTSMISSESAASVVLLSRVLYIAADLIMAFSIVIVSLSKRRVIS